MTGSPAGAQRRLARLERLLAGRQARLAAKVAGTRRPLAVGPIGGLQRHGYSAALLLAFAAVLPTVLGFGWRRRRLLAGAAANGLALRKLRKRVDAVRATGSGR